MSLQNKKTILIWLINIAYAGLFFPLRISNIPLILLTIFCIIAVNPREIIAVLKENPFAKLILAVFGLQVFGLLYTANLTNGLFVIEKKIWLLVIPFFLVPAINKYKPDRDLICRSIGILTVLSSVVLLFIAAYRRYHLGEPLAFAYVAGNQFEGFTSIHYVYYAMYFSCGSLFLLDAIFDQAIKRKYGAWVLGFLFVYSTGVIFLVASKMAIVAYGFVAIVFFYFKLVNKRVFFASITMLAIVVTTFFYVNEATRSRFEGLDKDLSILKQEVLPEEIEFTGLNLRLLFWKLNIKHAWEQGVLATGVGTGDVHDFTDAIYNLPQYKLFGYVGWDPHNQWVFSIIQLGVMGILIFGYLYFLSFKVSLRNKDIRFLGFLIITLFFSMTESILELNKGIVFFSLIFTLLIAPYSDQTRS